MMSVKNRYENHSSRTTANDDCDCVHIRIQGSSRKAGNVPT